MKTHELRFTETNSADDSAGKTWGLEGNLFWFMAGGAFASVIVAARCSSAAGAGASPRRSARRSIPLALALLYVFGFRQGKPPGYDIDLFELWLERPRLRPELPAQNHSPTRRLPSPCLNKLPTATSSTT